MAIPDWDKATGHLPPGRYRTSLEDVYDRFVAHPDMQPSSTRQAVWDGFIGYLSTWRQAEAALEPHLNGSRLASLVWLGGSFISQKLNPNNLDITLLVDGDSMESCSGKPGMGNIRSLLRRDRSEDLFKVTPCTIRYQYFRSPFRSQITESPGIEEYVMHRGAFDDWWQRTRPEGEPKGEPTRDSAATRRGYLEVEA